MDEIKSLEEAFHISIAVGSGNPVLAAYLRDINNHIRILRRLGFPDRKAVLETYEEHYELCELIKRRNGKQARKAMTAHIRKSQQIARGVTLTQLQQTLRRAPR
jgi:DNA-binding GntR family transcriptional regulator